MSAITQMLNVNPLAYTAVLVRLSIGQWRPEVQAPGLAKEVESTHGAQRGVVKVRRARIVHLLLDQINSVVQSWRQIHYAMTGAWGQRGVQMLPIALLDRYQTLERSHRERFQSLVSEFCDGYNAIVEQQADVLGGLYRPADYPSVAEVRSCYYWDVTLSPVPTAAPWWAQLPKEVAERLEADAQREAREGIETVMRDVHGRLADALAKLATTLSGESVRWHSTLLSNALEIADLLSALNVGRNADLDAIASGVKALLAPGGAPVAMDAVKSDPQLRETLAAKARELDKRARKADPLANLNGVI